MFTYIFQIDIVRRMELKLCRMVIETQICDLLSGRIWAEVDTQVKMMS